MINSRTAVGGGGRKYNILVAHSGYTISVIIYSLIVHKLKTYVNEAYKSKPETQQQLIDRVHVINDICEDVLREGYGGGYRIELRVEGVDLNTVLELLEKMPNLSIRKLLKYIIHYLLRSLFVYVFSVGLHFVNVYFPNLPHYELKAKTMTLQEWADRVKELTELIDRRHTTETKVSAENQLAYAHLVNALDWSTRKPWHLLRRERIRRQLQQLAVYDHTIDDEKYETCGRYPADPHFYKNLLELLDIKLHVRMEHGFVKPCNMGLSS